MYDISETSSQHVNNVYANYILIVFSSNRKNMLLDSNFLYLSRTYVGSGAEPRVFILSSILGLGNVSLLVHFSDIVVSQSMHGFAFLYDLSSISSQNNVTLLRLPS